MKRDLVSEDEVLSMFSFLIYEDILAYVKSNTDDEVAPDVHAYTKGGDSNCVV